MSFLSVILIDCQKLSQQDSTTQQNAISIYSSSSNRTISPSILQFQKCLGSTLNDYPIGNVIVSTPDGGNIIAANTLGNDGDVTGNHGSSDAWIIKLNSSNGVDWKYTFGGSNSDYVYAINKTSDGGYIFAGESKSTNGDVSVNKGGYDMWVVKLDASGHKVWQNTYGGSSDEKANFIIQTSDGGYLIAGKTQSNDGDVSGNHGGVDAWVVKLDVSGALLWQKTFGGSVSENTSFILPTPDGNFMISASSNSNDGDLSTLVHHGGNDSWLFKIDGAGNLLWQKTYGGSGEDVTGTLYNTSDGGYLFSTATSSNNGDVSGNHGYYDTWVVKLTSAGTILWQKCFGGFDMDNARVRSIDAVTGQMLVVGYTFSKNGDINLNKGGSDFWALLLDANGNKLQSNTLGGKSGDTGEDAVAAPDGSYIGVGRTDSNDGDVSGNHGSGDVWVVKFKFF